MEREAKEEQRKKDQRSEGRKKLKTGDGWEGLLLTLGHPDANRTSWSTHWVERL